MSDVSPIKEVFREVSPVSAWAYGEVVKMPSERFMRLRQLDVMEVLAPDGSVPNFMLPLLTGKKREKAETSAEDMLQLAPVLKRVAEQCVVEPKIVSTMEEVEAGKGILISMIPMNDKLAMLNYAMGGAAAVDATARFLRKQAESLDDVPEQKQRVTESETGDLEPVAGPST